MKSKNILKYMFWVSASVMFSCSTSYVCRAEEPQAVCERCLDNNELLMDDSAWLEIAKYQQYSLLMRVDPLPGEPISFDQGCTYGGYSDSNAQISVNRWFERLKPESILKKYAVGNNAVSNLGCFGKVSKSAFSYAYDGNKEYEELGNGISLPSLNSQKSAFLLSSQEAENYICYSENKNSSAFKNYVRLKQLTKSYFGKGKEKEKCYIKDSWLRSPGEFESTCSYFGELYLAGSINCKSVQRKCFVRPCLWVKSNIFSGGKDNDEVLEEDHRDANLQKPLEEILKPINSMIGMNNFKETISDIILKEQNDYLDRKAGQNIDQTPLHMIITGNPGTGKTTAAEKICEILYNAGLIKKKNLIKVEKKDIVGQYIGHTEKSVKKLLNEAEGGVLFIDEAYTLVSGGENDFGKHVIDGILTAMTENKCIIIVAGYPEPMEKFINSNPGLKSRFTRKIHLNDYNPEDLFKMFKTLCEKRNYKFENEKLIESLLLEHFKYKSIDRNFGNGRDVKTLFDAVLEERSEQLSINAKPEERALMKISYIKSAIGRKI